MMNLDEVLKNRMYFTVLLQSRENEIKKTPS
ncbi:hypothetical protein FLSI110296_06860 [Flavobacterium sinopsychrotolerans]